MTDLYEKQKESSGSLSTIVFIITGFYLFIVNLGFSSLISLKALGFFVVGMFASAIVIGIPAYLLQRLIVKGLMRMITNPYSTKAIKNFKLVGVTLLFVQILVTIVVTNIAFQWLSN